METPSEVRLDKWLWAVRAFKTRSLAITACNAGHVKIEGQRVKPARTVRIGESITVQVGDLCRTLKVLAPLEKRVGAQKAKEFVEDLTPPAEYEKQKAAHFAPMVEWPKGKGRPTKRSRRLLHRFSLDAGSGEPLDSIEG